MNSGDICEKSEVGMDERLKAFSEDVFRIAANRPLSFSEILDIHNVHFPPERPCPTSKEVVAKLWESWGRDDGVVE